MLEHLFTLPPLRGRRSLYAATFAALLLGCGPGSETGAGGTGTTTGSTSSATTCPRGAVPGPKGACMPVGIQGCADMFWEDDNLCHPSTDKCPVGTIPKLDYGCIPVGVPGCSPEFAEDGMCGAKLTKCPEATFPIPQEGCRPIDGPDGCGDGTWGNVVEAMGDVHVDPSAPPGGDGTRATPYQTIAEALQAVSTGGRVVIAAGTYDQPVVIQDSIEVVGRCASMVTITAAQDFNGLKAVLFAQVDGAALRNLTVEGHQVLYSYSKHVTIDGVVVRKSAETGIFLEGGQATVTHTWVHDTRIDPATGDLGDGVAAVANADLAVAHSAITASPRLAVLLADKGTAVHVEDTLLEQVLAPSDKGTRVGIVVQAKATLEIANSVVTGAREMGISLLQKGTTASITNCEVRDTSAREGTNSFGDGINVDFGASVSVIVGQPGTTSALDHCLFEKSVPDIGGEFGVALLVTDGEHTESTACAFVANALSCVQVQGAGTTWVSTGDYLAGGPPNASGVLVIGGASASLSGAVLQDQHGVGLFVHGSSASLSGCSIDSVLPLDVSFADQTYKGVADGVLVMAQSKVDASDLTVEGCERTAMLFEDSLGSLSGTRTSGGRFGLVLQGDEKPTLGDDNAFRGTEEDVVTGGDLSVPNAPLPIPTK